LENAYFLVRFQKTFSIFKAVHYEQGILHAFRYLIQQFIRSIKCTFIESIIIVYSRVNKRIFIHVIGDSHARVFKGNMPFIAHHIGAATAYNLIKDSSSTDSHRKLFNIIKRIKKNDIVVLIFGEIDCRIHTYYQFKKNNERYSIEEIIDRTIENYDRAIKQIKNKGIIPCICSISPATIVGNEYNYPFYASPQLRSRITRLFNQRLQELCRNNSYCFIDVYSRVSDCHGFMLSEYAGDEIHLNERVVPLVKQEIQEKLGIRI